MGGEVSREGIVMDQKVREVGKRKGLRGWEFGNVR